MNYIPSVNIELNKLSDFQYIITENAKLVAGNIANNFISGHHSFTIIGTYGTGKSSFILALEDDLMKGRNAIINRSVLGDTTDFVFLKIVGDYASLRSILAAKLNVDELNVIDSLGFLCKQLKKQNKFLIIVIDEFGKVLEYAAKYDPEKELYFLQKLSEFVNTPSRKIILLTTLHQNFGSYATRLNTYQRNEWQKVKGRFKEIVFVEPVEQLLTLTANQLGGQRRASISDGKNLKELYRLGIKSRIVSNNLSFETTEMLYPLDPVSAVCLTHAIQRYGQNERSLFSFLSANGEDSIGSFMPSGHLTYNVAVLYDYFIKNFYSEITEMNADSMGWRALYVAIERIESSDLETNMIKDCLKIIKTIGLINMFFNGVVINDEFLMVYGRYALDISDVEGIVRLLQNRHIIRYAKYKSQYILYEGTNINIEDELYKAASVVSVPTLTVEEIYPYIKQNIAIASASYYRTGTPRYFEYRISNEPVIVEPKGDIDGFIHLIFPLSEIEEKVKDISAAENCGASIYGYFKKPEAITRYLYEIKKLQYVIDNVAFEDRIASVELEKQKAYEMQKLNEVIGLALTGTTEEVVWYFKGKTLPLCNIRDFNKGLSYIVDTVYYKTPIIRNELFNRQKLSSAISLARVNLLDAMLNHSDEPSFGITSFPPEKTIYMTLFRNSGIHRMNKDGSWILGAPTSKDLKFIWEESSEFLKSTVDKARTLSDLVKILSSAPYKVKQGVIDFWIPIFLYINQQEFALYNGKVFVLNINKEVFELIQKRMADFSVKAFQISGIKLEFFKRYRQFLKKDDTVGVQSDSLIETVKPFFHFYRNLNNYAKTTRKFDNAYTSRFRDILSEAHDPAKTFFEDLPVAFGYKDFKSEEFIHQYLDLIRRAVRELNSCYGNLIDRIETKIVEHLGLPADYEEYKSILQKRYSTIDLRILPPKTRSFLERVIVPSGSKREFIEKISVVITDKRLDETKDSEEPLLISQLLYAFSELERYSAVGSADDHSESTEAYNFELASNRGDFSRSQTYRLPKNKAKIAEEIASRIESQFSDDNELNICVLLKLLNKKIR